MSTCFQITFQCNTSARTYKYGVLNGHVCEQLPYFRVTHKNPLSVVKYFLFKMKYACSLGSGKNHGRGNVAEFQLCLQIKSPSEIDGGTYLLNVPFGLYFIGATGCACITGAFVYGFKK